MVCSKDGRSSTSFSQGFLYTKLISSWLNVGPGMESKTPNGRGRKVTQLLSLLLTHLFTVLGPRNKTASLTSRH